MCLSSLRRETNMLYSLYYYIIVLQKKNEKIMQGIYVTIAYSDTVLNMKITLQ